MKINREQDIIDDAYDILDKGELINSIQNNKTFSKFNCKLGIWQIRMHANNIQWTAFACPLGHYEWLVMPFGQKNAPNFLKEKWVISLINT